MKFKREIIGLDIEVRGAKNKDLVGVEGKIIDESKNSILIKKGDKKKRLLKDQIKVLLIQGKAVDVKKIANRPEERIR